MTRKLNISIFLILLFVGLTICGRCQNLDSLLPIDYDQKQSFEIGQISVDGSEYSDENALIGVSGLKVGDIINISGRDLPDVIKAIHRLSLFTDVSIVATKIIGDVAFLEIRVKEHLDILRILTKE